MTWQRLSDFNHEFNKDIFWKERQNKRCWPYIRGISTTNHQISGFGIALVSALAPHDKTNMICFTCWPIGLFANCLECLTQSHRKIVICLRKSPNTWLTYKKSKSGHSFHYCARRNEWVIYQIHVPESTIGAQHADSGGFSVPPSAAANAANTGRILSTKSKIITPSIPFTRTRSVAHELKQFWVF